ncbi:MAG: carboxypeptidase-like regulatory domain-containing protein, partial [Chitinophagaceae bacterium]
MRGRIFTLTFLLVSCSFVLLFVRPTAAQEHEISGKVIGSDGNPLPGITIQIKGTSTGTTTDANGIYQLNAPATAVLIFQGIGYNQANVKVEGRSTVNVTLKTNTHQLSELVVTALGIQKEAKTLGYAETTIGSKSLTAGRDVNVQQALNGKVSGLNIVTTNSSVFQDTKILIRGIRSLTGNNQPMLVVDGAPTPLSFLSTIPPSDIAKVTILKSAASAAIYGPSAVNGVIIITTKRGGEKPSVTVTSTVTASRVAFFPKAQHEFGYSGGEITDIYGNNGYVPFENVMYGPAYDGTMKPVGIKLQDGSEQIYPYSPDFKNDKIKFWNTGLTVQNSVSYATKNSYLSFDDANIKGLVPQDKNRRTSLRFNSNKEYGNFSVNYGLNYVLQNWDITNQNNYNQVDPSAYVGGLFFAVEQVADNVPLHKYKDWQNNKFAEFSNYYDEYTTNPYWLIGNVRQKGTENDLLGDITLNYKILPWMKATVRLSSDLAFQNFKNTNAPIIISDWAIHDAVVSAGYPPYSNYSYTGRNPTSYSDRPGTEFDDQNYSSRLNMDYFLSGTGTLSQSFKLSYIAGGMVR